MIAERLGLKDYRNYDEETFCFSPGINLIHGDNAQGKTGVLEAVFFCATGKSHRGSKDRELIRFGQNESHVKLNLSKKGILHTIDVHLKQTGRKGIAIDRQPLKRVVDLYGMLNVIFFAPDDLSIIKSGPSARRDFLDTELCQLDRNYAYSLSQYNKALAQKSSLLKQLDGRPELRDTLDIWNEQLVNFGREIIERREEFTRELAVKMREKNLLISDGSDLINTTYEPNVGTDEFESRLKSVRSRELAAGMCLAGPHRDDIAFDLGGADVRRYGSQGQQRTAALSMKLAEIELVKEKTGDMPVLLLDDVLSELDAGRQKRLLSGIEDIQTIITTTGLDDVLEKRLKADSVFYIKNGKLVG